MGLMNDLFGNSKCWADVLCILLMAWISLGRVLRVRTVIVSWGSERYKRN